MILGKARIVAGALETHRDTYAIDGITVIAVRRELLSGALLFAAGGGAFLIAFADVLYAYEIATIASVLAAGMLVGVHLGQLKLLSRDLRGTELSDVIWGSYGDLNRLRREIAAAMRTGAAPGGGKTP